MNRPSMIALPIDEIYSELYHGLKSVGYENHTDMIIESICHLIVFYSDNNSDVIMNDIEGIIDSFYHADEREVSLVLDSLIYNSYYKLNILFKGFELKSPMFQDSYGECYYSHYQFHSLARGLLFLYDYVHYIKKQDNYEDIFPHLQ